MQAGFTVFNPAGIEDLSGYTEAGSTKEAISRKIEHDYIRAHYRLISQSQGILVLNYAKNGVPNYLGGNTLMEMGFAFTQNKDIFLLNPIPDVPYSAEITAMQPIVIHNDLSQLTQYYADLPKAYISSQNQQKILSASLGLREYNYRYDVIGLKTTSGISEQPTSIEETYQGAQNRLADLKKQCDGKKWFMLISLESGNAILHPQHNLWGLSVCIIETPDGQRSVTIDTDLEIPKDMTDQVPSQYPDLGILVQQKYGLKNKDPYVHFTHGKLDRQKLMINSIVNTLASLK